MTSGKMIILLGVTLSLDIMQHYNLDELTSFTFNLQRNLIRLRVPVPWLHTKVQLESGSKDASKLCH